MVSHTRPNGVHDPLLRAPGDRAVVAAFDVDGTLTRGDSLLPFLASVVGPSRLAIALCRATVRVAARPWSAGRESAKSALITAVLSGRPRDELVDHGSRFARSLLDRRPLPDGIEALRAHQRAGHLTVLISASPDLYVAPLGVLLGADATLATRLAFDEHDAATGRLAGPNLRGNNKIEALRTWMRSRDLPVNRTTLFAYGNSSGDDELLAAAGSNARDRRVLKRFTADTADTAPTSWD